MGDYKTEINLWMRFANSRPGLGVGRRIILREDGQIEI